MKTSKNIAILTILIVLIAAVALFFSMQEKPVNENNKNQTGEQNQQQVPETRTYTASGTIQRVEEGRFVLQTQVMNEESSELINESRTVVLFDNVEIIRWTNSANGGTWAVLTPADLRTGMKVNVSTKHDPVQSTTFVANKIEIIQ